MSIWLVLFCILELKIKPNCTSLEIYPFEDEYFKDKINNYRD